MAGPKLSEFELAMLSPTEREGVEDTDHDDPQNETPDATPRAEQRKAEKAAPTDDDDDAADDDRSQEGSGDDDDDDPADPNEGEPAKPAIEAKKDAKPKAAPKADADDAAAADDAPAPTPERPALQLKSESKDWDKLEGDIVKRYEDGEISEAQYRKELRNLSTAEAESRLAAKINEAAVSARWEEAQDAFMQANPRYGEKPGLRAALAHHIDALEQEDHAAKRAPRAGRELLAEAHRRVNEEFGFTAAKPKADDPAPEKKGGARPPPKTELDGKKKAIDKAPRTLADLPAASDDAETGGDEFEHLDKLDGMPYERALAALSVAQREKYLQGA